MTLSISHISFSKTGGAGRVADALSAQQRAMGHDASFYYITESNLKSDFVKNIPASLAAGLDNFVIKNPAHNSLVSLTRDSVNDSHLRKLPEGDVLHLHWINGLGRDAITKLSKRFTSVVMTMHDMNPITAVCHQALECKGYLNGCSTKCPAVRRPFQNGMSKIWRAKMDFLCSFTNFQLIAPSRWLEKEAIEVTRNVEIPVNYIPNPMNPQLHMEATLTLSKEATENPLTVFGFIANDIRDPNKNFRILLDVLTEASRSYKNFKLLVAGYGSDFFLPHALPFVDFLGPVNGEELAGFYTDIDILVVPSTAENSPLVVAEAACFGKRIIMRDISAAHDFSSPAGLVDLETFKSTDDLLQLILSVLQISRLSKNIDHQRAALDYFSSQNTTLKNVQLYFESLGKTHG